MTTVDKLLIQGIRSFSPTNHTIIEFYRPLTIIVGDNGAGKTTVIECLKYASTGDLPPSSQKGQTFVHDTKIAGVREVKAQIKMQFRNVTGQPIVCTRSMQLSQKGSSLSIKTLDSSLQTYNKKREKVSQSYRCGDIDKEIPLLMGVSKPILQHVIFCHQEESNWPLSEASQLKKKFDDIFAATRYTKALETIRKFKKDQGHVVTECKLKLETLSAHKEHAKTKRKEMRSTSSKVQELEREMSKLKADVSSAKSDLESMQHQADLVQSAAAQVGKLEAVREQIQMEVAKVYESIQEEYTDDLDTLMELSSKFDENMEEKRKRCVVLEAKLGTLKHEKCARDSEANQLASSVGELRAQRNAAQSRLRERNEEVLRCCAKLLKEHPQLPDSAKSDVAAVMDAHHARSASHVADESKGDALATMPEKDATMVREMLRSLVEAAERRMNEAKEEHDRQLHAMKEHLAQRWKEHNLAEQSVIASRTSISDNNDAMEKFKQDAKKLKEKYAEWSEKSDALAIAVRKYDELKQSPLLDRLSKEEKHLDEQLREAEREIQTLNMALQTVAKQGGHRAELDMLRTRLKEKKSHQDSLERELMSIYSSTESMPLDLSSVLSNHQAALDRLVDEISKVKNNVNQMRLDRSGIDATLNDVQSRLSTEMERLEALETRFSNHTTCSILGDQPFLERVASLEKEMEEKRRAVHDAEHTQRMLKKYKRDAMKDHACPICVRPFETDESLDGFVNDLTGLVDEAKLQAKRDLVVRIKSQLDSLKEMEPAYREKEQLKANVIAAMKKDVDQRTESLGILNNDIEKAETMLADLSREEERSRFIVKTATQLDHVRNETHELETRALALADEMEASADGMSADDISAKVSEWNEKRTSLRESLDLCRTQLEQTKQSLNDAASMVHEKREANLSMKNAIGDISSHEKTIATLKSQNEAKAIELQSSIAMVANAKDALEKARKNKEEYTSTRDEMHRSLVRQRELVTSMAESFDKLNASVASNSSLAELDAQIEILHKKARDVDLRSAEADSTMNSVFSELKADQELLAQSEVTRRNISDNIQYHKVKQRLAEVEASIKEAREQAGSSGHDLETIQRSIVNVKRVIEKHSQKLNQRIGVRKTLKSQLYACEKELSQAKYKEADVKYANMLIELKTTEMANADLEKYHKALEKALTTYHSSKMEEINKIIKELWQTTYKGADIDTIEIRADAETSTGSSRRVKFNYRVVMIKGDTELNMRGRCSAGQKVLASLVIRLALAETFCVNCGILALDEPTTNLDRRNVESLASALASIISSRRRQANFQLIIITHDEEFVQRLGRTEHADHYYRITKDVGGHSKVAKRDVRDLA